MAKFDPSTGQSKGWQRPVARRLITFAFLFGLWLILSGHFIVEFIVFGAVACALVVWWTAPMLETSGAGEYQPVPQSFRWLGLALVRLSLYLTWLIFKIVTANLQVVYLILHPKLPISPSLVTFRSTLDSETAQILLAQSITLTPGTITVDMERGVFVIHSLVGAQDELVASGGMQERVARVFGEELDPAQPVRVITDISEVQQ